MDLCLDLIQNQSILTVISNAETNFTLLVLDLTRIASISILFLALKICVASPHKRLIFFDPPY